MMNETGQRILPDQSSGSVHTFGTPRHPSINDPILSKRVRFYKSGDPQFNGLRMVINNRTFKTFDALLDSLSKKVPLPFGVRNITTPRGVHAIYTLDELEDGKSYICSDSHKVKPINLALARRRLPPWYHARPVSSRRQTVQQARPRNVHRQEPVVVRTPKKLLVFRNGDPSVKHTVLLQKRTTPTFESILKYISELMQFRVVKLHIPDGRRVDGLPGLILCSGTVVAVGREPFRSANYNAQKPPTRQPTNRTGLRRLNQRYIVNRIHNSIAESSCDLPSCPTNSIEMESSRLLDSVAETEADTCHGDRAEGQGSLLPTEDDIEKSFRVNQDGSMTVEMRVRLTIKEEETVHWTTTLTRSSVANQLNANCLREPEPEQENCSPESNPLDLRNPVASIDTINRDKTKDDNDDDPPSLGNGAFSENSNEEDNIKVQMDVVSPRRAPTPGHKQIRKKQASLESIKSVTTDGIQEGMVGSYSYRQQTENTAMTEQYCMVKQSSTRPVPKPRRLSSVDANSRNSRNVSTFNSASMTEILQIESSEEEVTETVLHIYEQQTYQDNFLANFCAHGASTSGISFCRPATSEIGQLSSNNEFEPELWRPSTASESISVWRAESMSVTNRQQQFPKSTNGKNKKISSKPKVINKHVRRLMSPGKRQNGTSAGANEKNRKVKTFSSAGFIKGIYGNKSKSAKSMMKLKKRPTKSSQSLDDTVKNPNISLLRKIKISETVPPETSKLNFSPTEVNQPRGVLTRQTSIHQEKKNKNESYDVSESMSLPAFTSSSSVTNKYVENWLEKVHLNPIHPPTENVQGTSVKQRIQSFEKKSSPSVETTTVTQQIAQRPAISRNTENGNSFLQNNTEEIKPHSNGMSPEINQITNMASTEIPSDSEVENKSSPIKISIQKATPSNTISMELPPPPSPPPAESPVEQPNLSNTEHCIVDIPSVASSPLYKLSSVSSQTSDNPLSISPTSDKDESPTDHTMEMTTSVQTDTPLTLREAQLPRTSSIKKAPLVSNLSLERKMSLRKACLDKYTLCSDANLETNTIPINPVGDNVPTNDICSTETQHPSKTQQEETQQSILDLVSSPSFSTSVSPTSLTSEEKISSDSISSCETPTPSNLPFNEAKASKTLPSTQNEVSPKPLVKKVKLMNSPSPERKPQTKKLSAELLNNSPKLSSLHNHPLDKSMSPNIGIRKYATPNASPSSERKLYKSKLQKRPSPYSQSLDMVSPPVRHKSNTKWLSGNLSTDNASESSNKTQRQTPHRTQQSIKSTAELDRTSETSEQSDDNKLNEADDLTKADGDKSMTDRQITPQPLNITNQPNMKPLLEKICYSIKSIRQITQNKRPSCLEKSNSLPDFSSHVASTFGSSSKALLAFLSVMTLKEGITNLNMDELNANNVSCAEALKMIDSLREIASIEDSHKLKTSLSDLQKSASKQLLESWRGFQEVSKSRSSTPNYSEQEFIPESGPDQDRVIEENIIDELMGGLDIPETLKEELASLSVDIKSESDNDKKTSSGIIEKVKLSPDENSDADILHLSTNDAVNAKNVAQEDEANVDVSSIVKKFTDKCSPQVEHNIKQIREERRLYGQVLFVKESSVDTQTCRDVVNEENHGVEKQQQEHSEDTLNQENANVTESCSSELEEQDMEFQQSEESMCIPENELTYEDESGSDEEGQKILNVHKDLEQKVSCKESVSSSEVGEQQSTEEELEVECEEIKQESREGDLSSPESHFKPSSTDYYVEVNASRKGSTSSPDSENQVECAAFSNSANPESQTCCMGLNVSANESMCNSDFDEPSSSEEEQPKVECKELKVIVEEGLSDSEEEQESVEEEEHLEDPQDHEEQMKKCKELSSCGEETEQDEVSSEDEDIHADEAVRGDLSNLIENQDSYIIKDKSSLIQQSEDSGNDHSSCEEHVVIEQPKVKDKQISSSTEEELSYYVKESRSEEEHANIDRHIKESCAEYQGAPAVAKLPEDTKCEKAVEKLKHQSKHVISQSVAERVSLLEKQVADSQNKKTITESSAVTCVSQKNAPLASDVEESSSESPTSQSALSTRSAPQSSLSFSYDSSGVITAEPEGSRVKSIREMFLAKSSTDIQHGQRRLQSQKVSELSELRTDTSASGGYQSQTSGELSSGEEDSLRTSITKGFVRRTIERLYGKKDANPDETVSERPPSAPKQKKKEHSSIFSPFHVARSKAMSELSYFNSSNALDTLNEVTRCIAFNAQVGPGDSVPIDIEGRWLLKENTLMRKSVSDPVGINKNCPKDERMCEDTEESTPYSLFSTKPELEDTKKSLSRKCTYFSLPHASDSDVCQDDLNTANKSSVNDDSETKDNSEDTKTWAERNGTQPGVGISDFKMMDNKVHPLIEGPADGEVVAVQPGKGQGVVNRRIQEPDALDLLYNFCGQHCPIL
ncbi:hypothetical protein PAMP_011068 [Pampus punctatissimus]